MMGDMERWRTEWSAADDAIYARHYRMKTARREYRRRTLARQRRKRR